MRCFALFALAGLVVASAAVAGNDAIATAHHEKKHHHHKHHHHHHDKAAETETEIETSKNTTPKPGTPAHVVTVAASVKVPAVAMVGHKQEKAQSEEQIVSKMKKLENELSVKEQAAAGNVVKGTLEVNGPLPADFNERFAQAAGRAVKVDPKEIKVLETSPAEDQPGVAVVVFEAPMAAVHDIEDQASDPSSELANSPLHRFLVADGSDADSTGPTGEMHPTSSIKGLETTAAADFEGGSAQTPVQTKGIDIDTEMPYGELEPFGREDTAQELTEQSVKESDEMVDQLERAEVAEEKRSVFRALTRLRGAAITSFDGIARSQTGNIDEYNKVHQWRTAHPLHHLADEESDISKWAFPDNADF